MGLKLSDLLGLTSYASWKDGLLGASFRGAKFFVDRISTSGGRRVVTHTFPEKDDSYNEDLGKKENTFSLSGYVLGNDYFYQRDELEKAINEKGIGVLVHPYRGQIEVNAVDYDIEETAGEGRLARFNISFVKNKDLELTEVVGSPIDRLESAKADFLAASMGYMSVAYDVANLPNAILDDMNSVLQIGLDTIFAAKTVLQTDDVFRRKLDTLRDNLVELILSPGDLAAELLDFITYGTLFNTTGLGEYTDSESLREQYFTMKNVIDFTDTNYSSFPSATSTDGDPLKETTKFISRCAVSSSVGFIGYMDIDNSSEANGILKDLGNDLEEIEQDELIDDNFRGTVRDLRVSLFEVIRERKLILADLIQLNLPEFEPGIKLGYDLYQDPTRDIEIAKLNGLLHPGFIFGQQVSVKEK